MRNDFSEFICPSKMGRQSYWILASISSAVISHNNATFQLPPKPMSSHPRRRSIISQSIIQVKSKKCGHVALPVVVMSLSHSGQALVICPSTSLKNKCKLHHLGCFMTLSWTRYSPSQLLYWRFVHHFFHPPSSFAWNQISPPLFLMPILPRIRHPKSSFTTFNWFNFPNALDNSDLETKRKFHGFISILSKNLDREILQQFDGNDVQFISYSISIAFLLNFNLLSLLSTRVRISALHPLRTPNLPKRRGTEKLQDLPRHGPDMVASTPVTRVECSICFNFWCPVALW